MKYKIIDSTHPAFGRTAILRRQKAANDSAWYEVEGTMTPAMIATGQFPFALGGIPDSHGRTNHCVLWPEQVEEVRRGKRHTKA